MQNSVFLAAIGECRNVLPDVVVHGELALLHQKKNACVRNLLRGRADVENGLRRYWDVFFNIGEAVALGIKDFAVAKDAQSAPGRSRAGQVRKDFVDGGGRFFVAGVSAERGASAQKK